MTSTTEPCQEIAAFLKSSSILKVLDEQILWGVSLLMEEISYGKDELIFSEGSVSDSFYIVRSGSVEIQKGKKKPRPVAYLTAGECFGELGLIQGTARAATVRVPESATVLKLAKNAFDELRRKFPKITTELAELINTRSSGSDFQPPGLSGDLSVFDLATVIQTISSSKQSGLLGLSRQGTPVAALDFEEGKLTSARFETLKGETAFYDLLQKHEPLSFTFEVGAGGVTEPDASLVSKPVDMLLIEGMRRSDELASVSAKLSKLGLVVSRTCEEAEAPGIPGVQPNVFPRLWNLLAEPVEVPRLQKLCAADQYSIFKLLEVLHSKGLVKRDELVATDSVVTAQLMLTPVEIQLLRETGGSAPADEQEEINRSIETGAYPSQLSQTLKYIYALNNTANGLSIILDNKTVRSCLTVALVQAQEEYAVLSKLKVLDDIASIDFSGADKDFLEGENADAVKTLTYLFLGLIVYSDWFSKPQGSLAERS